MFGPPALLSLAATQRAILQHLQGVDTIALWVYFCDFWASKYSVLFVALSTPKGSALKPIGEYHLEELGINFYDAIDGVDVHFLVS